MAVIFNITHDDGTLNGYTSTVTDGGDLSAEVAAALASTVEGLNCLIDDQTIIYGRKDQADTGTGKLRLRFYVDPNGLTIPSANAFKILRSIETGNNNIIQIYLGWNFESSGLYRLFCQAFNDANQQALYDNLDITDAEHYVELYIQQATDADSQDGSYEWWVDGVSQGSATGVDIFTHFANFEHFRIGAVEDIPATTDGTFFLDEFTANNDGSEIGPVTSITWSERGIGRGIMRGVGRGL